MIKALIIDDEPLARSIIRTYLDKEDTITVVAECGDGFEGVKAIQEHKPDLIFLDIQMPKLTGFEMLEIIDEENPHIIFTTAYDEYALKAFEKNAIDYLLKPISVDRFQVALEKFQKAYAGNSTPTTKQDVASATEEEQLERIVVKNRSQIKIIPVQKIIYLEAYDDYVKIHTQEGTFLKNKTMRSFERQLDDKQFVRVHRSFIVKIDQIERIEPLEKENYIATLLGGEKVNISKTGYARLKQVIGM